jgi:restriction system protein
VTGRQFEFYYASLLRSLDWTDIEVIGVRAGGDGGIDILATDPHSRRFAIQCKRYTLPRKVDIDGPRRLNASLAHEHQSRLGLIVTSSELTRPARALAGKSGIQVVERPGLAAQMARLTDGAGQDRDPAA